jgi:medium-chain acyl-[acyl-carrier-protein] hydrolase
VIQSFATGYQSALWLPGHRPGVPGRERLFCFPHAGGGSAAFHPWVAAFPMFDVCAVEYPGRWTRVREPAFTNLRQLVTSIADGLDELLVEPHVFVGHSYGALVAYELARELRRRGIQATEHLFAASARAPHLLPWTEPIRRLPDPQFVAELDRRYGRLPRCVLESVDVLQMVLRIIRADLTAFETYAFYDEPPLRCRITALRGRTDLTLDERSLDGWREHTASGFSSYVLEGDHFFLHASASESSSIIQRELARVN